ncbi:MAG: hypothetical protein KAV87_51865 [Desulfobacteraceae bacterium]|nr:hypothetical protein [Desulfobacteraceae bacterium]
MKVIVKGSYTILGEIQTDAEEFPIRINCPSDNSPEIVLEIDPKEQSIEALGEFEITDEFWNILSQKASVKKMPGGIEKEASMIRTHLITSVKRVLNAIKYCLKHIELEEELLGIKGTFWSIDKKNWEGFPGGPLSMVLSSYGLQALNKKSAKLLEDYLVNGPEPFLALSFLHRAKRERNPKYRWIDATIAAELAVKEFLILFKPEIEPVLLEVPSPPLHKLYGSILESYTGQRSPRLKEIAEGARVRNLLVHRPEKIKIDAQESTNYIGHVEAAIGHLLSILHPIYYRRHLFVDHHTT